MKEFKHRTYFNAKIKPLISEEKDKYLALASLMNLADFIPDIDTEKNIDLLPIAFNSFVANRVNKNDDVVDGDTSIAIAEYFVNKPINIEHDRHRVIGTILNVGYSEFGTDRPLTEEQVKGYEGPFNVTLGGVLWRVVNNSLTDMIEEAGDPTSPFYQKISASWELGFDEYQIVLLDKEEKNLENGEIIADHEQVKKLKGYLRSLGGDGEYEGKHVYRQVLNNVVPLGIGLTENPAADVKGVATNSTEELNLEIEEENESNYVEEPEKENILKNGVFEKNISHTEKNNVIENKGTAMEIKSIKDINEETLSNEEVSASAISDFIESELKKASEDFATEKASLEEAVKAADEKHEALVTEHEQVKNELDEVKKTVEAFEAEKTERDKLETFNERMSVLDDKYVLENDERELIASDIKDMDEEGFSAYATKLEILLKHKTKEAIAEEEAAVAETKEEAVEQVEEAVASETQADASEEEATADKNNDESSEQEVVEEAIDQAEQAEVEIPVTTAAEEASLADKYKKAFSIENFDIKL